jgi:predicted ribonuclease toxin of YeeF-YezG toxin-antitoxin module
VKGLKVTGNSIKGTGVGLFDVVKDTAVGLYDTVTDPIGTVESLYHSVTHPVETYKYIEKAIVDSYEREWRCRKPFTLGCLCIRHNSNCCCGDKRCWCDY